MPYKVGNSINTIANFVKLRRPFDIFTKKLFCNILVSNHHGQKHNDEEEADSVENATKDELIQMYKKESTMSVARYSC